MKYLIFFLFILGCSSNNSYQDKQVDEFDRIISIMKTRNSYDLLDLFGPPEKREDSKDDKNVEEFSYKQTSDHSTITAYFNKKDRKISRIWVSFWKDFDNYTYLKKRFKNYQWIEKKLPDAKGDVLTDLYLVTVPELNMTFEYDNYAPKRKVMWMFFD